ncbi:MAG: 16S rRNA (cytosine(1402)-N(4))-methyltransferase RsmH [Sutterellaceae bacterium]|nr:16S rRNA (cytosine(1402)-N(4))-methyltransferase RsmH [Sutterellaceae bacterium]
MTEKSLNTFQHFSVLGFEAPREVLTKTDGIYVDATFGRGGHTRTLLSLLDGNAHVYAFDRDPQAVEVAKTIDDNRFTIIHAPFSRMKEELAKVGVTKVDGVLMDIGVSSPQIDDAERGFSFRMDGPLDMRMDTTTGVTAAEWINNAQQSEIERVLRVYGEEKCAFRIAKAICARRKEKPFTRTGDLAEVIGANVTRSKKDAGQNPATRSFQAIRIHINAELKELEMALNDAGHLLMEGGKLAVISFHSLEDRIVKHFLDAGAHPEKGIDARIVLTQDQLPQPLWTDVKRIKPSQEECEVNARSRSAVMRSAVRTAKAWEADE